MRINMKKEDCKIGTVVITKSKSIGLTFLEYRRDEPLCIGKIVEPEDSSYHHTFPNGITIRTYNKDEYIFLPKDLTKVG